MSYVQRYQKRISGPPTDRIDIHLEMMRVPFEKLSSLDGGCHPHTHGSDARLVGRTLCPAAQA